MKYVIALILYFIGGGLYVWYWSYAKREERLEVLREEVKNNDELSEFAEEWFPVAIAIANILAVFTWPIDVFLDIFKYKVLTR